MYLLDDGLLEPIYRSAEIAYLPYKWVDDISLESIYLELCYRLNELSPPNNWKGPVVLDKY